MPRKIAVSFALDPEQVEKLEILSQRTKVPKSVFVREAIDRILKEQFEKEQLELFSKAKAPKRQPTP